jgi:hypothetical protein
MLTNEGRPRRNCHKLPPSAAFEYFHKSLFFCNPILFAICTNTFIRLCKNMYTYIQWHVEECSIALLIGSRPLVALGNKTYKLNLKN